MYHNYNTLGCWVARLINQASDGPSIILIDWKKNSGLLAWTYDTQNFFIFVKLYKNKKDKLKGFLQRILQEIMKK